METNIKKLTAIYVNCIFFTLWKSYDIFWFWFHLFLCICFPALRPENYLIVFIRLIYAKYGEYSDKSFKEIYEQFYIYNEGKTNTDVHVRRVESLRREKRKNKKEGNKADDGNVSSVNEVEENEIGGPTSDPNLLENEEQAMPNIRLLDSQKETKESKQEHFEVLITYREPPTNEQNGLKNFIPSFLTRKSDSQKQAAKIEEGKCLQETDKEKAEKLLAKREWKEKKRREKELFSVLKERANVEKWFNFNFLIFSRVTLLKVTLSKSARRLLPGCQRLLGFTQSSMGLLLAFELMGCLVKLTNN
ncbi:unnamed protein product [Meloidogyne enterolobii]|uniref:Uncharacterized protein n=1 Tax=Meloidogyne enterolobii TaxID=390850 RepID=A0ACB1B0D7_MELEN